MDCDGSLMSMRVALLGALVVLANALSAYVVVKTRGSKCATDDASGGAVVAARATPKKRRRDLPAKTAMH